MQTKTMIRSLLSALILAALNFSLVSGAQAQVLTDIHDFNNINGATPVAKLIFDSAGNLYGTTTMSAQGGGNCFGGCGVAFKLSHNGSGWKELVLHGFSGGVDGGIPMGNLVFDASGNLYGTTKIGGNNAACINSAANTKGCGVVFELSPQSGAGWTEKTIYAFAGGADGAYPEGGLVFDAAGNLYGITTSGGSLTACSGTGCGTVFELSPSSSGWTETIIHSFVDGGTDGVNPIGSVIFDGAGNLYGATVGGGIHDFGTVFALSPSSSGWTETSCIASVCAKAICRMAICFLIVPGIFMAAPNRAGAFPCAASVAAWYSNCLQTLRADGMRRSSPQRCRITTARTLWVSAPTRAVIYILSPRRQADKLQFAAVRVAAR